MGLRRLPIFLSLATFTLLLSSSHAQLFTDDNPIKLTADDKINCQSFRVAVEANNLRDWPTVPSHCKSSIKSYFTGKQYHLDVEAVAYTAEDFAYSIKDNSGKKAWVFDVEETLLSNLKYLKSSNVSYGTKPINTTAYYEWLKNNTATADPAIQDLFSAVQDYGYDTFIISEAPESFRADLTRLLNEADYSGWTQLILKGGADNGKNALQFKAERRGEIVGQGYTIVGNVGDQWSDLSGENAGTRTFKIPNPVYYIS